MKNTRNVEKREKKRINKTVWVSFLLPGRVIQCLLHLCGNLSMVYSFTADGQNECFFRNKQCQTQVVVFFWRQSFAQIYEYPSQICGTYN
jgi:hypothetical protein